MQERSLAKLALLACLLAVLAAWWLARDAAPFEDEPLARARPAEIAPPEPDVVYERADGERPARLLPAGAPSREPVLAGERDAAAAGEESASGAPAPPASTTALLVRFVAPDGRGIEPPFARVELRCARGAPRVGEAQSGTGVVRFEDVALERVELSVTAEGFEHRAQSFDLQSEVRVTPEEDGRPFVAVTTILWPRDWVAIAVRTSDGRPFTALAEAWGLEPRALFASSFGARVSSYPPPASGEPPAHDPSLGAFHGTHGYKSYELPGSAIGSLKLLRAPPLWVGLELYGELLAWQPLVVHQQELLFLLDAETLDAKLARLELRVIDRDTGEPLAGAQATLRADSSARRRASHSKVESGADGRIAFERIVPGRYELDLKHGASMHQDYLTFEKGERRDAGDVRLGKGVAIEVRVVDRTGAPARAYVECGPYAAGLRTIEIFPQSMRHSTGSDGREKLPSLDGPMLLRAAIEVGRSNSPKSIQEVQGVRSATVVVDPKHLPPAPIELVLLDSTPVVVTTTLQGVARIDIVDRSEVVVARATGRTSFNAELVPDVYRVIVYDAEGLPLRRADLRVEHAPVKLEID